LKEIVAILEEGEEKTHCHQGHWVSLPPPKKKQ